MAKFDALDVRDLSNNQVNEKTNQTHSGMVQ